MFGAGPEGAVFRGHPISGEIPKQVTRRKTIKRTFFNISSSLGNFTDNFKTDLT